MAAGRCHGGRCPYPSNAASPLPPARGEGEGVAERRRLSLAVLQARPRFRRALIGRPAGGGGDSARRPSRGWRGVGACREGSDAAARDVGGSGIPLCPPPRDRGIPCGSPGSGAERDRGGSPGSGRCGIGVGIPQGRGCVGSEEGRDPPGLGLCRIRGIPGIRAVRDHRDSPRVRDVWEQVICSHLSPGSVPR